MRLILPIPPHAQPRDERDEDEQHESQRSEDGDHNAQARGSRDITAKRLSAQLPPLRPVGADIFLVDGSQHRDGVIIGYTRPCLRP